MDLVTLDPATLQPLKMVESFDSLIWTERYNTVGDFQIISGNIDKFMQLVPEGTLLSLRESNIVMMAETHQIDRKKNTAQKVTIKGRSFESVLDRRITVQSVDALTNAANWTVNVKTPSDLAYYIINKICVEGILDPKDIFESNLVQFPTPADYLTSTGPTRAFTVNRGNLLTVVLELLAQEAKADATTTPATPAVVPHGIRAVRPSGASTAVGIQIYTGVDKTATVRFEATRDMLDDGTYLFSKVGSANVAYGIGQNTAIKVSKATPEPSGLARRVILVDGSTSGISDPAILGTQVSMSLADAHETALFDGSINQDLSTYQYGVHYGLGDTVTVVGDYGLVEKARITELIRSQDNTGMKAYPTLSAIPA